MFFIKYLRTLGFSATNDIFAENAWYFRNALVRANYTNLQKGMRCLEEVQLWKGSGASKLLSNLVKADIIEPVSGHGKGKYKFKK